MNNTNKKPALKKIIIALTIAFLAAFTLGNIVTYAAEENDPCADNVSGGGAEGENVNNPCVQPPLIPKPDTLPGPSSLTDTGVNHERYLITDLIPTLVRGAINLLGGITIIALMYAGIQYLTAFGDDTKLGNAKKNLIYAIVGLLIAIFSYTIVRIISEVPLTDSNEIPEATSDSVEYTP